MVKVGFASLGNFLDLLAYHMWINTEKRMDRAIYSTGIIKCATQQIPISEYAKRHMRRHVPVSTHMQNLKHEPIITYAKITVNTCVIGTSMLHLQHY